MTFATESLKPGRGRAIRVDVSVDSFTSVAYRWGDIAGLLDGTNQYTARVLELGQVRRALGQNRVATSTTTTLDLDNADGALDFLCGSTGLATAAALRFRIYIDIYDPGSIPADISTHAKQLGEFVLSSWPSQNNTTISLALADDMMGLLGPGLELPNFIDWSEVGNASNNPIYGQAGAIGIPDSMSEYTPIQLAFGEDWLLTHPLVIPAGNNAGGDAYQDKVIIPLYCTLDVSAVDQALVTQLRVERHRRPDQLNGAEVPELVELPRYTADFALGTGTPSTLTVWAVEKSPTITKAGKDYQVVYLVVRTDLGDRSLFYAVQDDEHPELAAARMEQLSMYAYTGGYPEAAVLSDANGSTGPGGGAGGSYAPITSRVINWYVKGVPLSQTTNAPVLLPGSHSIDVMTDLVSVYSDAPIDSTTAARVKAGTPSSRCFGVVQAWSERANNAALYQPPMSLRQVLTSLAQSADIDIFVNWAGQISFASDVWDFTTATQAASLIEIPETSISSIRRWVPSGGERHSAFNRIYFEGGRSNPAEGRGFGVGGYGDNGLPFQGPWDLDGSTIPITTRIVEVGLQQGWRPWIQQRQDPVQWRTIDSVSRDRVTFRMGLDGLRLELGDYFKLLWTRGPTLGGPYATATVFQCEGIVYVPGDDSVEIEAVWRDDTQTERQYLLDDETLLVRAKPGPDTLNMTDGLDEISTGGSIAIAAMGVQIGDILVLRDTTQAADVFTRNKAMRIVNIGVLGGNDVSVSAADSADLGAPAGATVANADWYIVRGATTYPTAVSDPTNYPSGGDMYGKVTAAGGTTSDAATGNRLISG